jgi:negative regulator of sigma E activity
MNNDELDSQLSAMFDGELPASECELLARRLARDDLLKARWGRYATIGAAVRVERGIRLDSRLAERVSAAVAAEPALLVGSSSSRASRLVSPSLVRWWQPVGGAAVAAGVAAAAILWLRGGSPDAPISPDTPIIAQSAAQPTASVLRADSPAPSDVSDSYVVPPTSVESSSAAPPMELADFVVAHSAFSMPLLRRSALAALVAAESAGDSTDASRRPQPAGAPQDSNKHADPAH